MKILYLCDRAKECAEYGSCNSDMPVRCKRTPDPAHAKNGACRDPQNHPERFVAVENKINGGLRYYYEIEREGAENGNH